MKLKSLPSLIFVSVIMLILLNSTYVSATVAVTTVDDLDVEGMKIGVIQGSSSDYYAMQNFDLVSVLQYADFPTLTNAYDNNEVHAIIENSANLVEYLQGDNESGILDTFNEEIFGIGVREEDLTLLQVMNAALDEIISDPVYNTTFQEWFDFVPGIYAFEYEPSTYPDIGSVPVGSTFERIINNRELQYGMDPTYPPFEVKNNDGTYSGFDIDLMELITTRIAERYNMTLNAVVVDSDWDPIIPNLQSGEFDVILSAMTITLERDQQIDFTRGYFASSLSVLGPSDGIIDLGSASSSISSSSSSSSSTSSSTQDSTTSSSNSTSDGSTESVTLPVFHIDSISVFLGMIVLLTRKGKILS